MKKYTQTEIIKKFLESNEGNWVVSWKLQKVETQWGFLGTSADREARRMAESGEIERKREGKYAYFRLKSTLF